METRCRANAILSLKEYLADINDTKTSTGTELKTLFEGAISGSLRELKNEKIKEGVKEKLKEIEQGKRDLFY